MASIDTGDAVHPRGRYESDGVTLYQADQPGLFLFTTAPRLAGGGQPQAAVTLLRNLVADLAVPADHLVGGTALFTLDTGAGTVPSREQEDLWRTVLASRGVDTAIRFAPLPWRTGAAQVALAPGLGTAQPDREQIHIPGNTHTFLISLTASGADAWERCISQGAFLPAALDSRFEYPCRLNGVSAVARVEVLGETIFSYFARHLPLSPDGFRYATRPQVAVLWEEMTAQGFIRIRLSGTVGEAERMLTETASEQALQRLWDRLWVCRPDLPAPEATANTADPAAGTRSVPFALAWRSLADARNYCLTAAFGDGVCWLAGARTTWLGPLFRCLTPASIMRVSSPAADVTLPARFTVEGDPAVRQVAVSWSATEGHTPQSFLFGPDGGSITCRLTARNPASVRVRYTAKVLWRAARWPVMTLEGEAPLFVGGDRIVVRPGALVRRHRIVLRRGGGPVADGDALVVSARYTGPHLSAAIAESRPLTQAEPFIFTYPADPEGRPGYLTISAWGVLNGALRHAAAQTLRADSAHETCLIVADADQGSLQVVPAQSASNPFDDRLFTDEKEEPLPSANTKGGGRPPLHSP